MLTKQSKCSLLSNMFETIHHVQMVFMFLIAIYLLIAPVCWSCYLLLQIRSVRKICKRYKRAERVDSSLRSKLLENLRATMFKDVLLILMLVLEWLLLIFMFIFFKIQTSYTSDDFINSTISIECHRENSHLNLIETLQFNEPWLLFIFLCAAILFISTILLFSFLSTYLKRRYYGHSLDNRLICKYVSWWSFQVLLLSLSSTPFTHIFFYILLPILIVVDFVILFRESRKLGRAIRSVLDDIRRFENDDVLYRSVRTSYSSYKTFVTLHILALFAFILIITFSCIYQFLQIILFQTCYLEFLYHIQYNLHLDMQTNHNIAKGLYLFEICFRLFLLILYMFLIAIPQLIFLSIFCLDSLCKRLLKRRIILNREVLLAPLL